MASIEITKEFPPTRERAVLLELLRLVRELREQGVDAIVCGGWVPFLKEMARVNKTAHTMSLDIDVLLRPAARERETIDRLGHLLRSTLGYQKSRDASFRYEKNVEGNLIEVELLTDGRRSENGEAVIKVYGTATALDVCLADGADALADHVESIHITYLDGESKETAEIRIPDAVGFLLLKTTVTSFRQKPKDPYDIYYYCRYSEDLQITRQKLCASKQEQAVRQTIERLRHMFADIDYQWVDMALEHMNVTGSEREREAQFVVRTIRNVTQDL